MSARPKRQGEGALSDAIRDALAHEPGLRLWRNSRCAVVKGNRMVRGGLGENGSADLIGVLAVDVTVRFDDVTTPRIKLGVFIALEVKLPGEIPTAENIARALAKVPVYQAADTWRAMGPSLFLREWSGALRELDARDRHMLEQEAFLAEVRAVGGFACYVDSPEAARAAIARARQGAAS